MVKMNMVQALNLALEQEMSRDDGVVVLGEDIGAFLELQMACMINSVRSELLTRPWLSQPYLGVPSAWPWQA